MRSIGLLLAVAACSGDECPGIDLEMREHRGEDVEGVDIRCDGDFNDPRWTQICRQAGSTFVGYTPEECAGTTINVVQPSLFGIYPRLIFREVDGELIARGFIDYITDVSPGGAPASMPETLVGAVAPQEHGENGRYRGRFELLVELNGDRGTLRGTYDTTNIVDDEGKPTGRSCYDGP